MLQVYLSDLAAYNKGYLLGEWIRLPMPQTKLRETLEKLLASGTTLCFMEMGYYEKHEEHFITDYEWEEMELYSIDEYANLERLNHECHLLETLSQQELKALKFILDETSGTDIETAMQKLCDVTIHENASLENIAYELVENGFISESNLLNYVDYEKIARDLRLEGLYYEKDGDVYEYAT